MSYPCTANSNKLHQVNLPCGLAVFIMGYKIGQLWSWWLCLVTQLKGGNANYNIVNSLLSGSFLIKLFSFSSGQSGSPRSGKRTDSLVKVENSHAVPVVASYSSLHLTLDSAIARPREGRGRAAQGPRDVQTSSARSCGWKKPQAGAAGAYDLFSSFFRVGLLSKVVEGQNGAPQDHMWARKNLSVSCRHSTSHALAAVRPAENLSPNRL